MAIRLDLARGPPGDAAAAQQGTGFRIEVGVNRVIGGAVAEQSPQRRERGFVPAGVHDAQVVAHQRQRQPLEERRPRLAALRRGRLRVQELAVGQLVVAIEVPAVAVLGLAEQHVELVIAEDALRPTALDPVHDEVEHGRAVRTPVAEVAHEHRATTLGVPAVGGVAEVPEQRPERLGLAVDVADQVQRSVEQTGNRAVREARVFLQHSTCIFTERRKSGDRG